MRKHNYSKFKADLVAVRQEAASALTSQRRVPISWRVLDNVRRIALRKGVYYSVLQPMERAILALSIRCRVTAKSKILLRVISIIIGKISSALGSFMEHMEILGRPLAQKMSEFAYQWGNKEALNWKDNIAYARFLGLWKFSLEKGFRA